MATVAWNPAARDRDIVADESVDESDPTEYAANNRTSHAVSECPMAASHVAFDASELPALDSSAATDACMSTYAGKADGSSRDMHSCSAARQNSASSAAAASAAPTCPHISRLNPRSAGSDVNTPTASCCSAEEP